MRISDFIEDLATVTGNHKLDSLTQFLEEIKTAEIPDDLAKGIKDNVLTKEAARNNPELHDHFTALALNGVDTEIERYLNEKVKDPKVLESIKAEKKTAKRAIKLAEELKSLESQKINATGGEKKALQDEIDLLKKQVADLNGSVIKEREERDRIIAEKQNEFTNQLKDMHIETHLKGYKYANDKIPISVHVLTAKSLQEQKLKELGLKTAFNPETGKVELLTTTNQIYYKDNKPVDFQSFTDSILAENHLLQVSNAGAPTPPAQPAKVIQSNGNGLNTSKFDMAMAESAKTFQNK